MQLVFIILINLMLIPGYVLAEEAEQSEPAIEYLEMQPKFTVNLAERKKYLMVAVQLMVEGKENFDKIKKHLPPIRDRLIMLFSGRAAATLQTMEQREALRKEALDKVRETLDKYANRDGLKDLFFTEFLVN